MPEAITASQKLENEIEAEELTGDGSVKPIGIIYPPPEVRNIVDKTASFVARNGPEFETRIRQNEVSNPKFNFLTPTDPYHAYYQHKVTEFSEGKGIEPVTPSQDVAKISRTSMPEAVKKQLTTAREFIAPKEPPPEYEFTVDPPSISALDIDIVKLTAQFVARNGRQFLTNLINREQRNYQFDFLRPQHSLFSYFTKLVEHYTKVLIPSKDIFDNLDLDSLNCKLVMSQAQHRVDWIRHQERERKKVEEEAEKERISYAQIDWHDFVVVETVDFQPSEVANLPPPVTPETVGIRAAAQERMQLFPDNNARTNIEMDVDSDESESDSGGEGDSAQPPVPSSEDVTLPLLQTIGHPGDESFEPKDMEESSDEEDNDVHPPLPPADMSQPAPPPLPPQPDEIIIKRDYDPKAPKTLMEQPLPDQYLISPLTGERIPIEKVKEHMRIGLLDPKWIEQRDRQMMEKQAQEDVFAPGIAIGSSLKQLAERRTDIFGVGDEETQIGKKLGEEDSRPVEKVTWDGHTATMEATTRKALDNITLEEQIQAIHRAKGLLPDEEKEKIGPSIPMKSGHEPLQRGGPPRRPPSPQRLMSVNTGPKPIVIPQLSRSMTRPLPQMPLPLAMPMMPLQLMRPMQRMQSNPMHIAPQPVHQMQQPQPPTPAPLATRPIPPPPEEEPPVKKQKTDEVLIPEIDWVEKNPGPVEVQLTLPTLPDKPEWNLNGQTLNFTIPITDQISVIKAKIHSELGMPIGKQKLQFEGIFIKDSNTLAYYNMTSSATISVGVKERGGRKK